MFEHSHFASISAQSELRNQLEGDQLAFVAAENFTNEGLDRLLGYVPGGTGTLDTTLYLAAITTAGTVDGTVALDGTKVPNRLTVWTTDYNNAGNAGATRGGGGEPTIGTNAYARKSVANGDWGAATTSGTGRERTTTSAESFASSTGAWSNQNVIGSGIVTSATGGAGVAYAFANFNDSSTVVVNATGIVLQVTPVWHFDI
jgi:hypothetical protein